MHPHEQLEQRLEKTPWVGGKYAVACNSGTAALHLALEALQLPPGEVIVPNYCMVAVARAVVLAGHTPVFVDCHPDTLLTDNDRWPLMVDATKYRATMVVHNYGREAYRPYDTMIIEDLAEAHGIVPDLRSVACWSFYKNKIVAGQEGGAVAFPKRKQADLARQLRCIGFTPEHDYTHIPRGHNYRLADSLVPPIMWSLDYFDRNVFDRKEWASQLEGVVPDRMILPMKRTCNWVFDFVCDSREQRDQIVVLLRAKGIEFRYGFKAMTLQEEFKNHRSCGGKVAEEMSGRVLYLTYPVWHRIILDKYIADMTKLLAPFA